MPPPVNRLIPQPKPFYIVIARRGEVWGIEWWPGQEGYVRATLGRWAQDDELDFNWADAEMMAELVDLKGCFGK